ncbi:hypothetical protein [Roseivivax isoporae]|uniref:Uncharacterized protein n=1 Tax=Roseivivax isoporae LMG 25204 TaxID=1449351 RepID=X7FBG5_9RHOB|nr:hypothetical protein [Roseivivax isoporae]ETX29434.1 hypothetical protein RISW2_23145 [Roseivivax isoporae LMG 25204]
MTDPTGLISDIDVTAAVPLLRLRARLYVDDHDVADRLVEAVLKEAIASPRPCRSQAEVEAWLLDRLLAHARLKIAIRNWVMSQNDDRNGPSPSTRKVAG